MSVNNFAVGDVTGLPSDVATTETVATAGLISVVNELPLASRPGAPATLFLDFNGHYQKETVGDVQGIGGWGNVWTPAFDRDSDPMTFSPEELQQMRFIWASVAEDYAPFNINVTTVDPSPGGIKSSTPTMRMVISGEQDFRGDEFVGFTEYDAYANASGANTGYVFSRNSGRTFSSQLIANAVSHEAGHGFGLEHRSNSVGNASRKPIMREHGVDASDAERGVWWSGEMAEIANSANGFGYAPDDHAGSFAGARELTATNAGLMGRGLIGKTNDVDMFRFTTGGGTANVSLKPPSEKFGIPHPSFPESTTANIGNLDATLKLYNAAGVLIASDADPSLLASFTTNLAAGTYYIAVGSYGNYGDVGQYSFFVTESVGPQVTASQPVAISSTLMGLRVTFDEPIDPLTFTTADVRINGGSAGAGVISIGVPTDQGRTFLVTFTKPSGKTSTNISIGPKISDLFGNLMDQNRNNVKAEAADAYLRTIYGDLGGTFDPTTTTTTKSKSVKAQSLDAAFARI